MATEEQLRVLIRTVADTSGAQQAQHALQQVTVQQQVANQVMRQAMIAAPRTLEGFTAQLKAVEQQIGARPTLGPEAFGITPEATREVVAHAEATKAVGESTHVTGTEVVRLGAAFAGLGLGLSAFTLAGRAAHDELARIVNTTIALDQTTRANTITLGSQAAAFQSWATTFSQQAGVTRQSLLEAGTTAAQFGRQTGGLGPEQLTGLTTLAARLALIRGADPSDVMTQLTQAMQGSTQAADALNLRLDDGYVAFTQLNGATAELFDQLDPGTQAWLRYQAALGQTKDQVADASGPVQDLNKSQSELNTSMERFGSTVGPPVVSVLAGVAKSAADAAEAIAHFHAVIAASDLGKPIQDAAAQLGDLAKPIQDTSGALQTAAWLTGFDALAPAVEVVGQAMDGVKEAAQSAGAAVTQSFTDADDALKQTQQDAQEAAAAVQAAVDITRQAAVDAARRNVIATQQEQLRLQHEQVDLTAQQAALQLRFLPIQTQMLANERELQRVRLEAQRVALGPQEALQDLQYQLQRSNLIAGNPYASPEARAAARRQIRGLTRAEPGVELTALEAGRPLVDIDRAGARLSIQQGLQQLGIDTALAPGQLLIQTNQLLEQIAAAQSQAAKVNLNIAVSTDGGAPQVFNELIEADGQAQMPPTIQVSAVRR